MTTCVEEIPRVRDSCRVDDNVAAMIEVLQGLGYDNTNSLDFNEMGKIPTELAAILLEVCQDAADCGIQLAEIQNEQNTTQALREEKLKEKRENSVIIQHEVQNLIEIQSTRQKERKAAIMGEREFRNQRTKEALENSRAAEKVLNEKKREELEGVRLQKLADKATGNATADASSAAVLNPAATKKTRK